MQRISTTVLGLAGRPEAARLRALAEQLGEHANVRAVLPAAEDPVLDRAVAAWRETAGTHVPFVVHDADPLAEVAVAWADRWDAAGAGAGAGAGTVGRLEVAVQAVLQRWRAGSLDEPSSVWWSSAGTRPASRHGSRGSAPPKRSTTP